MFYEQPASSFSGRSSEGLPRATWIRLGFFFALLALNGTSLQVSSAGAIESGGLKIGLLLPPEEPQGTSVREGALLAQEQANRPSNGAVQLIVRGRVGQWGADAVEAARMVTDEGVAGLITPPDGAASHLVLQVSGRTAVPVVSLCADTSVSRTGVPWMVRVVPRTTEEATVLFRDVPAAVSGNTNGWLTFVPDGRAGREIARDLRTAASACHCRLEQTIEIGSALTNADELVVQALSNRPNVVLVWLAPIPCAKLAKVLRAAGYKGVLTGPGWLRSADFIRVAGDAGEGIHIPGIVQTKASQERWRSFQSAYQQRWGHEPDWMAGMSYDAAVALIQIVREDDFQSPSHRLRAGFSWPGVTGDLTFDSDGNRQVSLEMLQGQALGFRALQKGEQ